MPRGRKSDFTQKTADAICERLSQGQSLREICRADDMPCATAVFKWLATFPDFAQQYARAKTAGIEALAEDILDIADDATNDWMERQNADGENTGWQFNGEAARRSQIRIDARKWLLSKLAPKKYGDKLAIGGADDLPPLKTMTDEQLEARIAALQAKANAGKD